MRRAAALSAAVLLVACGKGPQADRIADLLPKDAPIVVRLGSIEDVDAMFATMGPRGMVPSIATLMLTLPGAKPGMFRKDTPVGLAATVPTDGAPPALTLALRASDAEEVAGKFTEGSARALDGHLGLSSSPDYPSGGCALWNAMPEGDMTARVDLALLGGTENPSVDMFLRQLGQGSRFLAGLFAGGIPGLDADQAAGAFEAWLREVVDSGTQLDLLMDLDGKGLRMDVAYAAREGTRLAEEASARSGLNALAAQAPEGWPFVMLFRVDPAWIAAAAGAPELGPALGTLGEDWLLAGKIDDRLRSVIATRAKDGPAAGAALAALLTSAAPGIHLACTEEKLEVRDAFARRLRLKVDPDAEGEQAGRLAALLGPDGVPIEIVARKDLLLITAGEEGLAPRLLASAKPPASLAARLPSGENLHLFVAMDVGAASDGILRMAARLPRNDVQMPPLAGAFELQGSSSGRTWKWSFRVDEDYLRNIGTLGMSRLGGPPRPPR